MAAVVIRCMQRHHTHISVPEELWTYRSSPLGTSPSAGPSCNRSCVMLTMRTSTGGQGLPHSEEDVFCVSAAGIAYLGGVCSAKRKCVLAEDNGLNLAFTIAHELGHK